MILFDPNELVEWTPEHRKKDPRPPVFLLRPPTARRFMRMMAAATTVTDGTVKFAGEDAFIVCREALGGWRNITDRHGRELEFPGSEAAVERLDFRTLRAMAIEVFNLSQVPDEVEGESGSGRSSLSGASGINATGATGGDAPGP